VLITALVIVVVSKNTLTDGMGILSLRGLEYLAYAVEGSYNAIDGEFSYHDGSMYKGDVNLTPTEDTLDGFVDGENADVTLIWGNTRVATSVISEDGTRPVGTEINEDVYETLQRGENYETTGITIAGQNYFAVYVPLEDADGQVVGAIFAGRPSEKVSDYISEHMTKILIYAIILMILFAISDAFVARSIAQSVVRCSNAVRKISTGNLTHKVSQKSLRRHDEIGDMAHSIQDLIGEMRGIVGNLKKSSGMLMESGNSLDDMAGQSSAAADELSHAVEDISKGAVSQAEEIEIASKEIETMGSVIHSIVNNVGSLTDASKTMSSAGDASSETMQELSESNDRTTSAINRIGEQIRMTNASIEKIGAAATLITNIADQTSLLSLNASIESARAGEAGKGFAVVAGEIQKLAVQSDEAAAEIQQIIDSLLSESEQTMSAMKEVEALIVEQQEKLDDTKERFNEVSDGITVSREGTDMIRDNAGSCDSARVQVEDVITNLSAIAQQNAASAEQTTASMEELNAIINMLAQASGDLKKLAGNLNQEMAFFQLEEAS
jgi:methyl-accepting chemotaxis protein